MPAHTVETLIVGGGQAGLAMSHHLSTRGAPHLILERHRIAERWRSERWDSLVANGPAWHDRFPALTFAGVDPFSFPHRDQIVEYFETFAKQCAAPIRCGVEVKAVHQASGGTGFRVETSDGVIEARNVVAATGPFQHPVIPALVPDDAELLQLHSSAYRNPGQLPDGGVLVVGSGSSGVQIADELFRAGKKVVLSVGPHDRPPIRYRGRDFVWWLGVLGIWDAKTRGPGMEHVTIAVSGAHGGHTVDFRRLAAKGISLAGTAGPFNDGVMRFAPDLAHNIRRGDSYYLSVLDLADAYADQHGVSLPKDPEARVIDPDPPCMTDPLRELRLQDAGITAIVWATGYAVDFSWIKAGTYTARGTPMHERGVTEVPGLYFLGLPWLSRRASPFIWGVWHDAAYLADHIAARRTPLPSESRARVAPAATRTGETAMAHQRIRPFNTRDTYPEQKLDNDLCQAVVTRGGRTVYLRGQCPQDLDTAKTIASSDPAEQTHKVMQNIRQLLEEAGGSMEHLVKVVVYLTDVRHREAVYRTMGDYIKGVHPVSTGVTVTALARPEWLVEIDATAVIPD